MTKKHFTLPLAAVLILLMSVACKKDASKSPQEMILGKWNYATYAYHTFYQGKHDGDTVDASSTGYYMDFRNNSKMYSYLFNKFDTAEYYAQDFNSFIRNKDTVKLSTFTENQLTIYVKEGDKDDYYEEWYTFKK